MLAHTPILIPFNEDLQMIMDYFTCIKNIEWRLVIFFHYSCRYFCRDHANGERYDNRSRISGKNSRLREYLYIYYGFFAHLSI